jgi:putative phosphoribosyl transferase
MQSDVQRQAAKPYLVDLEVPGARLEGELVIPRSASGVVLFAHGSGSSRHSPRNKFVAQALREKANAATLLIDLLSTSEEVIDEETAELRFNIEFLARRLVSICDWLRAEPRTRTLPIGLFGASTGAGAALAAAGERPQSVVAVVSRGGRPDLAGASNLARVRAPTLLIVGGDDPVVLELNQQAQRVMRANCHLEVIPGAGHLFAEPGRLEEVAKLASAWFLRHFRFDAAPARVS